MSTDARHNQTYPPTLEVLRAFYADLDRINDAYARYGLRLPRCAVYDGDQSALEEALAEAHDDYYGVRDQPINPDPTGMTCEKCGSSHIVMSGSCGHCGDCGMVQGGCG